MAEIILDPGEEFEHYHSNVSETTLREGVATLTVAGRTRPLALGEPVTVSSNAPHVLRNIGPTKARISCSHAPAPAPPP